MSTVPTPSWMPTSAARATVSTQPLHAVVAVVLGFIVLREPLTSNSLIGGVVVLVSAAVIVAHRSRLGGTSRSIPET